MILMLIMMLMRVLCCDVACLICLSSIDINLPTVGIQCTLIVSTVLLVFTIYNLATGTYYLVPVSYTHLTLPTTAYV